MSNVSCDSGRFHYKKMIFLNELARSYLFLRNKCRLRSFAAQRHKCESVNEMGCGFEYFHFFSLKSNKARHWVSPLNSQYRIWQSVLTLGFLPLSATCGIQREAEKKSDQCINKMLTKHLNSHNKYFLRQFKMFQYTMAASTPNKMISQQNLKPPPKQDQSIVGA